MSGGRPRRGLDLARRHVSMRLNDQELLLLRLTAALLGEPHTDLARRGALSAASTMLATIPGGQDLLNAAYDLQAATPSLTVEELVEKVLAARPARRAP